MSEVGIRIHWRACLHSDWIFNISGKEIHVQASFTDLGSDHLMALFQQILLASLRCPL